MASPSDRGHASATETYPKMTLMQRLAGRHWPNPTNVLAILVVILSACACLQHLGSTWEESERARAEAKCAKMAVKPDNYREYHNLLNERPGGFADNCPKLLTAIFVSEGVGVFLRTMLRALLLVGFSTLMLYFGRCIMASTLHSGMNALPCGPCWFLTALRRRVQALDKKDGSLFLRVEENEDPMLLKEPLLDKDKSIANAPPTCQGFVRQLASRHWPDPARCLSALSFLLVGAWIADNTGPATEADLHLSRLKKMVATEPNTVLRETSTLVFVAVAASVLVLAFCQQVCNNIAKAFFRHATQGIGFARSDAPVETGPVQAWLFTGRFEIRNCSLRNPPGYQSDYMLNVRRVTADFDVFKFLRSMGRELFVSNVVLEGVDVVVEKKITSSADESNLDDAIHDVGEVGRNFGGPRICMSDVTVASIKVSVVGGMDTVVAPIKYNDLSGETGVTSTGGVTALLVTEVCNAALASLGRISRRVL